MTDGRDVSETGDMRPWWRTSADDGDDPIARLLEEPGTGEAVPPKDEAATPDGPRPPGRRPVSLVIVALVAGTLAMVIVVLAALSADHGRLGPGDRHADTRTDPTATCHQEGGTCGPGGSPAGSGGGERGGGDQP